MSAEPHGSVSILTQTCVRPESAEVVSAFSSVVVRPSMTVVARTPACVAVNPPICVAVSDAMPAAPPLRIA